MHVDIASLAQRPDLTAAHGHLSDLWPAFVLHDPIADLYFGRLDTYAPYVLVATHGEEVVARALSVPFTMETDIGRPALPSSGWDGMIRWAWLDAIAGRHPLTCRRWRSPSHASIGEAAWPRVSSTR